METEELTEQTEGSAEKAFTQADVDRIIADRLARKEKTSQETVQELAAKLKAFEDEKSEREKKEMSALELAQKEKDELANKYKSLEESLKMKEIDLLKTELIAEAAPELPKAYRQLVSGKDKEELIEAIEVAKKQYAEDFKVVNSKSIGSSTNTGVQINVDELNPMGQFKTPYQEMMEKLKNKRT